jgi:hypothetical protein
MPLSTAQTGTIKLVLLVVGVVSVLVIAICNVLPMISKKGGTSNGTSQ